MAFFVVIGIKRGQKDIPLQKCFPMLPRDCGNKTEREKEAGEGEQEKSLITGKGKLFSLMSNPFRSSAGPWRVEGGGLPAPRT